MKHYNEKISAYLHGELPDEERQKIGAHLSQCADCRAEYDEIEFGAKLAENLSQSNAPQNLRNRIENELDKDQNAESFFKPRFLTATFAALVLIAGISSLVYFVFLQKDDAEKANDQTPRNQIRKENLPNEWNVVALSGEPKSGDRIISGRGFLTVGEILETDKNSRAKVEVADIGHVEIAPDSRLRLIRTDSTGHRLSLEKGVLQATIFAPPRIFIVDTPSAVAVDLGCAYTLEVDESGDAKIHVTGGFVALEQGQREAIVPAGAMAITKKGKGIGTPFAEDASQEFRDALYRFDFENGGENSLQTILRKPDIKTSVTLWHLLARVPENEREKVFEKLASIVRLPAGVTKSGILKLDADMLKVWRLEIEGKWFENYYGSKLS